MADVRESAVPDPGAASDLAEFIGLLDGLRVWGGDPSFRVLAKRVGPLMRPPQEVSKSTVADMFQPGRRRLNQDLVVAVVRALGLSEPAAAEWRAACVRVQAASKTGGPTGVLRQLPADLATFTGRTAELEQLMTQASAGGPGGTVVISAVEGMAGVGKTQLAVHAAHLLVRAGRYTDAQLYVNLRGFDPDRPRADTSDVLDGFLRALGVQAQHIPAGREARAAMFRDRLHGKHALLVLDNAADEEQVRDLVPAGPTCLVLVTSRRSMAELDSARLCRLDVFGSGEAVELLGRIAGAERVAAEPEAAADLVRLCGFLPLAVSVAASRLRSRPAWSLAYLVQRLRDSDMAALTVGGKELPQIFELSYQSLPGEAQRIFQLAALHVGNDFSAPSMAALSGMEPAAVLPLMDILLDENLVQENTQGRYNLHDLLRIFAGRCLQAEQSTQDRQQALERLLDWYLNTADGAARILNPSRSPTLKDQVEAGRHRLALSDYQQAQEWLDVERSCLMASIRVSVETGWHYYAAHLPRTMYELFSNRSHHQDWETASRLAIESARHIGDPDIESWVQGSLGVALMQLGRFDEAIAEFQASADIRHAQGNFDSEVPPLCGCR